MQWVTLILFSLMLVMFFVILVIVFFWESSLIFSGAPFIPVPAEVVPDIVKAMDLKDGNSVYDLGCGEGRVLFACAKANPGVECYGTDSALMPYIIARLTAWRDKVKRVTFHKKDMFKYDLRNADRVFLYLFPELMDKLLPKLQKELRPGSKVISCDFEFSEKQPSMTIDLKRSQRLRGQRLFVYEF